MAQDSRVAADKEGEIVNNQQLIVLQRLTNIKEAIKTASNELKFTIGTIESGKVEKNIIMDRIEEIRAFLDWATQQ